MPVLSNVDQVGEKGLIRYSPDVPKTFVSGTYSRTVEIDIFPAGLLFVLLDLFMHHHNTCTYRPSVVDRGYARFWIRTSENTPVSRHFGE
jgi:hypothetical protein